MTTLGATAIYRESRQAREAFTVWYQQDRNYKTTAQLTGKSEKALRTLVERYQWHKRADAMDIEAERIAQARAIEEKAEMLLRHRRLGQLMTMRSGEFLANTPLDNARDAITAAKVGVDLERQAEGLPQWVSNIVEADDHALRRRYEELQQQLNATRISGHPGGDGAPGHLIEGSSGEPEPGGD